MDDPMSQHDYQYADANPVNFTDPTGYFSIGDAFATIAISGILASIGGSVGYVGGQYLTGNGPDGEELLNMADQWVAGFANAVTFGATSYIRSSWYGEKATQNHSGFLWNMGQLAGLGSSLLAGGASPHSLKFSMSATGWIVTTHAVSGTAVSAWETGTHLREGRLEWTDAFTLLPLVSFAASSDGMRKFIGAARAVTERLRDWGGMQVKGTLNEVGDAVSDLLYGARVGEGLPGSQGVAISSRPKPSELELLSSKHNVEFAVTYKYGTGINGRGGQYYLHSGNASSVEIPLEADRMPIYHTHPRGTASASQADLRLMKFLQSIGSPQRSSQIVPVGKEVFRFNSNRTRF
jgi:hypothetical protein